MIEGYTETIKSPSVKGTSNGEYSERDLASILKTYWLTKAKQDTQVITIGLGIIINKKGKVLIGSRKKGDKWVKNLTWVFPGGRMKLLDFKKDLKKVIRNETGLSVNINSLISARVHPDSGFKEIQIIALYFHCTTIDGTQKSGGDLKELKWTNPTNVFKHFTTSTSDEVTKFLNLIEKSS